MNARVQLKKKVSGRLKGLDVKTELIGGKPPVVK
jgi:hypothetical protein